MATAEETTGTTSGADTADTGSFYDAIGGAPALRIAVEEFYQRILADPELSGFFSDTDMVRLKRHQAKLLAQVLGGPAEYDGRALGEAHRGMNISERQYQRVGDHLTAVLRSLQVEEHIVTAVAGTLATVQPEIIAAGAGPDRG